MTLPERDWYEGMSSAELEGQRAHWQATITRATEQRNLIATVLRERMYAEVFAKAKIHEEMPKP